MRKGSYVMCLWSNVIVFVIILNWLHFCFNFFLISISVRFKVHLHQEQYYKDNYISLHTNIQFVGFQF